MLKKIVYWLQGQPSRRGNHDNGSESRALPYIFCAHTVLSFVTVFALVGCDYIWPDPYQIWNEEVKLNDGRTVVVEQKKLLEGHIAREDWLTITLPELGKGKIVWHERLTPMVVNIDQGRLYVIGRPSTIVEFREYKKPKPIYIAFVWGGGSWSRVAFDDIPESIRNTNMYIEDSVPSGTKYINLEDKKKQLEDAEYGGWMKKISRDSPSFDY